MIKPTYYGIFTVSTGDLEVFVLERRRFRAIRTNDRGHFPIEELGVELGVWAGYYGNEHAPWLRWFDDEGVMLLAGSERARLETRRADEEKRRAEALAAKLRAMGIDPDEVAGSA